MEATTGARMQATHQVLKCAGVTDVTLSLLQLGQFRLEGSHLYNQKEDCDGNGHPKEKAAAVAR